LKQLVAILPDSPGIYQFFDQLGKIIYVGKAKNLKKRVTSYFSKTPDPKTAILVRKIADIKHLVVETEQDAFLLENNLIKQYKPRYNIMLKDDKTYPWIVIKNEPYPRVFLTRQVIKDGSAYYGPYTSVYSVRTLLALLRKIYRLRTCKYNISPEAIAKHKIKTCLDYHIGNCAAPCQGFQSREKYAQNIDEIKTILKGNIYGLIKYLRSLMLKFAEQYKFEDANKIKEKLTALEKYQSKSAIVSMDITNLDIYGIEINDNMTFINFLKVMDGAIVQTFTEEIKSVLNESPEELLAYAIIDIRQKIFSEANEILVPFIPDIQLAGIKFKVPKAGELKKLLDLAMRNATYSRMEKEKQMTLAKPRNSTERILETMKRDLHLTELPVHIECFDNSNLQGTNPVASCVVFKNGKPAKKDYRHFNVKSVDGPNDYASMVEIITRRYRRLLDEKQPLPQLVIIDGGKGQLAMAVKALESLNLHGQISLIGIAKRLEEIYFPQDSIPLYLDKNSETLRLIQQARDEAHRFGITFHRNKRSSKFTKSEIESIPGLGPKTVQTLLLKYKSLSNIKKQQFADVCKLIGTARTTKLFQHFKWIIEDNSNRKHD
jgi:excinuclease ABC subunit C